MDTNYREQILGSPYVNEGFADRLVAKTTNALQGISAMTGGSIRPEDVTKIHSLWVALEGKVSNLLKDWKQTSEMLKHRNFSTISSKQKRSIANWDLLYQKFAPFALAGVINPPKRHDSRFVTPSPISTASKTAAITPVHSSPSAMVAEGIWTRPLSILWALRSNDTSKILAAYQTELKKIYDEFINDAVKITKSAPEKIVKIVNSLKDPATPEKLKLIRAKLGITTKKKAATPPLIPPSLSATSATPPSIPSSPTTTPPSPSAPTAPATPTPPVIAPPVIAPPVISKSSIPPAPSSGGSSGSVVNNPAEATKFVSILSQVVDIIIDTVKSDVKQSQHFLGTNDKGDFKKPLPSTWNDPVMTKPTSGIAEEDDKKKEKEKDDDVQEIEGEFLYNFASHYRKLRSFNIEMEPRTVSKEVDVGGVKKELSVIWQNKEHQNIIWVKYFDKTADPKYGKDARSSTSHNFKVFSFYDDEVNPRTEKGKQFSIEKIYLNAQPDKNPFSAADKKIVEDLNKKTLPLLRSLYATVYRKSMEFVSKKKSVAGKTADGKITWNTLGVLNLISVKGDKFLVDPEKTSADLPEEDIAALAAAGYQAMFPEKFDKIKPKGTGKPSPTPTPTATPTAPPAAAPVPKTESPPSALKAEPPAAATPEPAPESPKAEPSEKPSSRKTVTLSKAKGMVPPKYADTVKVGARVWVGAGKPSAEKKHPDWAKVVPDESSPPKTS